VTTITIDGVERVIDEVFYDTKTNCTMVVRLLQDNQSCTTSWGGGRKHPQLIVKPCTCPTIICEPMQQFEEGMLIRFEGKLYRIAKKWLAEMQSHYCTTARCDKILNSVVPLGYRNHDALHLELIEEPKVIRKCASRVIDGIKRSNGEVFFDAESGLWGSLQEQKRLVTTSCLVGRKSPTKMAVAAIEMQLVLVESPAKECLPKFREYKETSSQVETPAQQPELTAKDKRHLSISVLTRDSTFVIASQSHHGENFAFAGNAFIATNGVVLISDTEPKLCANGLTLFVHGRTARGSNNFIKATDKQYAKIKEAVDEYNATNGGSPKLEWPQPGDIFFAVGGMSVISDQYDPVTCKHLKDSNNLFQEREAAEKAAAALPAFYKSFQ